MIKLGKIQTLKVERLSAIGVFLIDDSQVEDSDGYIYDHYLNVKEDEKKAGVLLPKKEVPEGTKVGDKIEVFVYKDSEDRPIATTKRPKLVLGELQPLKVVQDTKIGAFMDWGLQRDLLLPFREQTTKIKENNEYLVSLYVDKSKRLCATMDVYKYLSDESPYKQDDKVKGIVISVKEGFGAFVAVDNKYHGLIPENELYGTINCGNRFEGRVTKVRDDGKLNISLKEKAYIQMDKDSEIILNRIIKNGGTLPLNDKSTPEEIKAELNMSKKAFKRAVGRLLKEGKIKFKDNGIEKI